MMNYQSAVQALEIEVHNTIILLFVAYSYISSTGLTKESKKDTEGKKKKDKKKKKEKDKDHKV